MFDDPVKGVDRLAVYIYIYIYIYILFSAIPDLLSLHNKSLIVSSLLLELLRKKSRDLKER